MKTKLLIADGMSADSVEFLKKSSTLDVDFRKVVTPEEMAEIIGNYEVIAIRSATKLTAPLIERATKMKLIVRLGAGVDNIDVPAATAKKIAVMNTAAANALSAAEQAIALMFATARRIPQAYASLKAGKWERELFTGTEITGKTLAVLGCGQIGRIVAQKAAALGMNVVGYDPFVKELAGVRMVATVEEAVAGADWITLHLPKIKETTGLVNAGLLAKFKKGACLVNAARGGICVEADVMAALDSGQLAFAAFDVFEKEPPVFPNALIDHPKVICVPHLGASTAEAQTRVGEVGARQILGFFERGEKAGVINGL
jgi:D-3-phosphoglycerate dehydrogenase